MIKLVIPGRPIPKKRPRLNSKNSRSYVYTPPETAEYERKVGWYALQAAKGKSFSNDIAVFIKLYFKDRRFGDVDNYGKALLDAIQGIVFDNDKQVAKLHIERYIDDNERAEIEIREVG